MKLEGVFFSLLEHISATVMNKEDRDFVNDGKLLQAATVMPPSIGSSENLHEFKTPKLNNLIVEFWTKIFIICTQIIFGGKVQSYPGFTALKQNELTGPQRVDFWRIKVDTCTVVSSDYIKRRFCSSSYFPADKKRKR